MMQHTSQLHFDPMGAINTKLSTDLFDIGQAWMGLFRSKSPSDFHRSYSVYSSVSKTPDISNTPRAYPSISSRWVCFVNMIHVQWSLLIARKISKGKI